MKYLLILFLLVSCKQEEPLVYTYYSPTILSDGTHAGFRTTEFKDYNSFKKTKKKILDFLCQDQLNLKQTFTDSGSRIINCFFPFYSASDSLDLALNIFAVLDYKRNNISDFSIYLSGLDFPNGGQITSASAHFNDKRFSTAGITNASWDFDNILKDRNDIQKYYSTDFYQRRSGLTPVSSLSKKFEIESYSIVLNPIEKSSIQLAYEFSLLRDENAAKIRIMKNGMTLMDTAIFLTGRQPAKWE